ncbi:NtaA/DmoA family FMN-dependent monooxygenase [Agrobacterium tumefaciens]|uniref:NtaA/DmoA family FMN-dependent monooxygenase n=1 Tax=Agrobacterium tumefaciens TaxID=358 RepID=UPI0021D2253D|nr:NtaA/DmoA family FMN-dependent monooxygenase [Agrobacterium tumefaciens]UXS03745.1 NtaA/DmoA family FMN-dependent monooxygenase [Agrobacterium tumefaciens]
MNQSKLHIGFCLAPLWLQVPSTEADKTGIPPDPIDFATSLAKRAEAAKLDFVFQVDYVGILKRARKASGLAPVGLEPTVLFAAIARSTTHIGMVTTASTTFNLPYVVARQMQSLNWISNGRIGWNIVTSIEGAENFGDEPMPPAETRYRKAAEFTHVVRRLWQSNPGNMPGKEPQSIEHQGEFFSIKGPLNVPCHASGEPLLFQAGASDIGRDFSASIANGTFAATPDMTAAIDLRSDLRRRARAHGRKAEDIKVLPGLHFFLAKTREEAVALHEKAHAHLGEDYRRQSVKAVLGLDLADMPLDAKVTAAMLPSIDQPVRSRTHADLLRRFIEREEPSVAHILKRPEVVGSAHWVSVGTPQDVAEEIAEWHDAGALDGFIALPGGSPASLALFFDELVPLLQQRGLFRTEYKGATLRDHLGASTENDLVEL